MAFAYVATVPSAMVFSGFFFLDFFFQNRPHPKKKIFFFFGENFCDVEKKNFFWARQRDKWHFVARLESLVALVALLRAMVITTYFLKISLSTRKISQRKKKTKIDFLKM